eukprot:3359654-Pleurochrysis_carterae.AAC.1
MQPLPVCGCGRVLRSQAVSRKVIPLRLCPSAHDAHGGLCFATWVPEPGCGAPRPRRRPPSQATSAAAASPCSSPAACPTSACADARA